MSELPESYPGPTPQDETVMDGNASFIEACKAAIAMDAEQFGWRFGNSILTRSKDGSLVWRADFETPRTSGTPGRVNRVVFWRPSGSDDDIGIAVLFGRPLDKLR